MKHRVAVLLILAACVVGARTAHAISLTDSAGVTRRGEPVAFQGTIAESNDVSGIAVVGDLLVIVSDEVKNPTVLQVLKKQGSAYRVIADIKLPAGDGEVDLEAVAADRNVVYVTGSHSATRKIKDGTIDGPERKKSREQFFRFTLNADGSHGQVEGPRSLAGALDRHAVLSGFRAIASKENGIDIEGLAVKDGRLYFGFRGPVLRDGWVPVLVTQWDAVDTFEVRYVKLDGRGIRDMVAVDGGFLILAGPMGDGDGTYRIYFWNGADQFTARGDDGVRSLAEFSDLDGGKPEGLAVAGSDGSSYELLVVRDGLANGAPMRFVLRRPR